MNFNLLTEDDRALIDRDGCPDDICPEYIIATPSGIIFTIRGIQFYSKVIRTFNLSQNLADLTSELDILHFHLKVSVAKVRHLKANLLDEYTSPLTPYNTKVQLKAFMEGEYDTFIRLTEVASKIEGSPTILLGRFG